MKKILATLLVVVMIAGFATVTAGASSYDSNAKELNKLGLLQGTDAGFDLDSAPTRAQAVVMLIRLLGLEETAKADGGEHPFTDVPEWADAYIGYAYANGLTNGISDTEFGTDNLCSAQMYVTLTLRALGYDDTDDGDFTYADALAFGEEVGIVDDTMLSGGFLRDQMVAVSYLALLAEPKDGDFETLLASLVEAGAVSKDAADALMSKLALLDEVMALGSELADITKFELGMSADGTMSMLGQDASFAMTANIKIAVDETDIEGALAAEIDVDGEALAIDCYIKDGFAYVSAAGEKMKVDLGLEDLLAVAAVAETDAVVSAAAVVAMYEDVAKATEGDFTVYTITLNSALMDEIIAAAAAEAVGTDMTMNMSPFKYYVDADGALKKIATSMEMTVTQTVEDSTVTVKIVLDFELEILATGDAVVITFPDDLDKYETVDLAV